MWESIQGCEANVFWCNCLLVKQEGCTSSQVGKVERSPWPSFAIGLQLVVFSLPQGLDRGTNVAGGGRFAGFHRFYFIRFVKKPTTLPARWWRSVDPRVGFWSRHFRPRIGRSTDFLDVSFLRAHHCPCYLFPIHRVRFLYRRGGVDPGRVCVTWFLCRPPTRLHLPFQPFHVSFYPWFRWET